MAVHKVPLGVIEQGCWQALASGGAAKAPLAVAEHMFQVEVLLAEKPFDGFGMFALVGKHEADSGIVALGFLKYRHFANTGGAPGSPQVYHRGLALVQGFQTNRLLVQVGQGNLRKALDLVVDESDDTGCRTPGHQAWPYRVGLRVGST